ncbi:MAG: NHL repeat-containing protein [Candidatus Aminicenantaceae bacterium]
MEIRKIIAQTMFCLYAAAALMMGQAMAQEAPSLQIQYDLRFGGLDVPEEQMFAAPIDMAVGPEGRVYVLDSRDNNIKVFASDGRFLTTFSREGSGPGELSRPWTLAFINGRLHVVDTGNGRIQVFSSEGSYQRSYQMAADLGVGMSFAPDGRLFINTRGFRSPKLIRVFDTQGQRQQEFGDVQGDSYEFFDFASIKNDIKKGRIPNIFKNDVHPVVGPDGTVWAVHRGLPLILRYSQEEELLSRHELDIKEYAAIHGSFLEENKKIENEPSRFFPLRYVTDVVVDALGDLYVLLNLAAPMTVLVFAQDDGSLLKTLVGPADRISRINFDQQGRLYALGADSHFIYRFSLD